MDERFSLLSNNKLINCFITFFIIASAWSSYSTGSKAGIIIGIICLIVLIATISIIIYRKRSGIIIILTSQKVRQKKTGGNSGRNVMTTVASYHNKQFESDKTNIKVAGKKGPQKFSPTSN